MILLKSTASQVVMLKLFLSSDHVTAGTGKTLAIVISKNGGTFANPNAGVTNGVEVSNGWYKVTLDATDTNTDGDLVVRGAAAACDDAERILRVTGVNLAASGSVQLTESYAALAAAPTLAQLLFEIRALLAEKSISGTVLTAKKIDGATTAETFTLNSSTAPTSITRAS